MPANGRSLIYDADLIGGHVIDRLAATDVAATVLSLELFAARLGLVQRMDDVAFASLADRERQQPAPDESAKETQRAPAESAAMAATTAALLAVRELWLDGYMPISARVLKQFPRLYSFLNSRHHGWTYAWLAEEAGLPPDTADVLLGADGAIIHREVILRPKFLDWLDALRGTEPLETLFREHAREVAAIVAAFGGWARALRSLGKTPPPITLEKPLPDRYQAYIDDVSAELIGEFTTPVAGAFPGAASARAKIRPPRP